MARAKTSRGHARPRWKLRWWMLVAVGGAAAGAAYVLSLVPGGTPVQQTLARFVEHAMWAAAAACTVAAAAVYVWQRYRARKRNPYARLKLPREPRFDTPNLGPRAAALAVGEPIIRIRDLTKGPRPDRWSSELLRSLEWRRFELLCIAYYGHRHFRVESEARTPDGASLAKLYFKELPGAVAMLACQSWGSRPVGVKPVRELGRLMAESGVAKGIFHTAGDYTNEAKRHAREHRVQLVTGAEFVANLLKLPEPVQKALLDLSTSGDYTTPTCPSCGGKMLMCSSGQGEFWGCSGYPRCKATLGIVQPSW